MRNDAMLRGPALKERLQEFGAGILSGSSSTGLQWPDQSLQLAYTGASGEVLLARTIDFLVLLKEIVPMISDAGVRGLDYGVGWGRIASMMRFFGGPRNLDCADAWQKSLDHARDCGLDNTMLLLPAKLGSDSVPRDTYDFIYSYSIFTHLPDEVVIDNMRQLVNALKPGGKLVFTHREPRFIQFLERSDKCRAVDDRLHTEGYWFGNAQSSEYGDTILGESWIRRHLGGLGRYASHGVLPSEPFQVVAEIVR